MVFNMEYVANNPQFFIKMGSFVIKMVDIVNISEII